jgi:hypothetical protein
MGFSLHIQRVDGRDGDLPVASMEEAIEMFHAIPWKDEVELWAKVPEEQREELRPLFQIFDDAGHALHITAYSDALIALTYNFPAPASPFGITYEEDQGYVGTNQFPREKFRELVECFYLSDTKAMRTLLSQFPMAGCGDSAG